MVLKCCDHLGISAEPALSALPLDQPLSLFTTGLKEAGTPPVIPNINIAFALQDTQLDADSLGLAVNMIRRPFPIGLHLTEVGVTVAASLDPRAGIPSTIKEDYHVNTVWPFMSYHLVTGLIKQSTRTDLPDLVKSEIKKTIEILAQDMRNNKEYYSLELFGAAVTEDGNGFHPKPFTGSVDGKGRRISCPIQLWSTLYTVTMRQIADFLGQQGGSS